jgi:hypothetical protein
MNRHEKLNLAAAATARGIQMREQRDLAARGRDALESYYNALDLAAQAAAKELADKLARDGVVSACADRAMRPSAA